MHLTEKFGWQFPCLGARNSWGELGKEKRDPSFLHWCNFLCLKEMKSVPKVSGQIAVLNDIKYEEKRTEFLSKAFTSITM